MKQNEFKDARLKYVEMPKEFHNRANDINLTCKQQFRVCQQLAVRLAKERPKTPQEFEKNEYLKDFVIKTSQLNEQVLGLLSYTQDLLNAIAADSSVVELALQNDTLRLQSETIEILTQQREDLIQQVYDQKFREISRLDKGAA